MINKSKELKAIYLHGESTWFYVQEEIFIRKEKLLWIHWNSYTRHLHFVITKKCTFYAY